MIWIYINKIFLSSRNEKPMLLEGWNCPESPASVVLGTVPPMKQRRSNLCSEMPILEAQWLPLQIALHLDPSRQTWAAQNPVTRRFIAYSAPGSESTAVSSTQRESSGKFSMRSGSAQPQFTEHWKRFALSLQFPTKLIVFSFCEVGPLMCTPKWYWCVHTPFFINTLCMPKTE